MIKVQINKICAKLIECEPLTSGMIGKTLEVEMSADWAGLSKTAVFSNGEKTIDVMESEWNGNTINIPWEVLETPNRAVSFGIYGYTKNGDDIILAIPTLYTSLGRVYLGVDPDGDESTEPSLPVYAQLDLRVTELEEHGGGGSDGVYIVHISLVNGAYHFAQGENWDAIYEALYDFDKVVVAELWDFDFDDAKFVYSFSGYTDIPAHGLDFVFFRAEGNKTRYLYVHKNNTISAEVVDLDDYALKSDIGDLADLDTTNKSNIVAAINEVAASGGTGWTSAQIDLLEAVFEKLVYTDAEGGAIAAQLINSLRGGVVPEEPITITFDGTKAVISGLGNTTITYSGTTAKIGYMPL